MAQSDNREGEAKAQPWSPGSWRKHPTQQQPVYRNEADLGKALKELSTLPPLVQPTEVDKLHNELEEVALGKRFLLQGGDCAELFNYCNAQQIQDKVKIMLQMSLILTFGAHIPVVRVARLAGQYAKPRSAATETVNGVEVQTFRGDIINGMDLDDREPDPARLQRAYFHSGVTLNYVRSLCNGGFTDLRKPINWDLSHVASRETRNMFESYANKVMDSLDFMDRILGISDTPKIRLAEFFTSHEGLLLDYEEALTRPGGNGQFYNLGAHFLWVGERTRAVEGGHVEYFRGLANPIGVKIGPSIQSEELIKLVKTLDPNNKPGHLTLITRYGADKIESVLPGHIQAVQTTGHNVVWCCDPMHGNTVLTEDGVKTRNFQCVLSELRSAFAIHKAHNRQLNGVHFELTGDNVTECIGGSTNLSVGDLARNYQSFCDPRLNYNQSIDMAFLIADYFKSQSSDAMKL